MKIPLISHFVAPGTPDTRKTEQALQASHAWAEGLPAGQPQAKILFGVIKLNKTLRQRDLEQAARKANQSRDANARGVTPSAGGPEAARFKQSNLLFANARTVASTLRQWVCSTNESWTASRRKADVKAFMQHFWQSAMYKDRQGNLILVTPPRVRVPSQLAAQLRTIKIHISSSPQVRTAQQRSPEQTIRLVSPLPHHAAYPSVAAVGRTAA